MRVSALSHNHKRFKASASSVKHLSPGLTRSLNPNLNPEPYKTLNSTLNPQSPHANSWLAPRKRRSAATYAHAFPQCLAPQTKVTTTLTTSVVDFNCLPALQNPRRSVGGQPETRQIYGGGRGGGGRIRPPADLPSLRGGLLIKSSH